MFNRAAWSFWRLQGSLYQHFLQATKELSSTLKELQSDTVEVVTFIAPPQLPLALEMYVEVEVKVTVKVKG